MPWTSHEIQADRDDPGHIIVIAHWLPEGGGQYFRYRERVPVTAEGKAAFLKNAIAARDAGTDKQVAAKAQFQDVQALLNAMDAERQAPPAEDEGA